MNIKSSNLSYHISYWIFVIITLSLVFGLSWGSNLAAFYFICMLLPIVFGTSYFFNYVLVPRFYLKKKLFKFGLYSFYTVVISLYLEMIVLMFSFIYLGHFSFENLGPNASDTVLLGVILYLLVFVGSFLLMAQQIKENQDKIKNLLLEKEKSKITQLEIVSNRKKTKIPYQDILYIESLTDYIQIHTSTVPITSKEKISNLAARLPDSFLRIHRSFVINKEQVKSFTSSEIIIGEQTLNIGRSYKALVREDLKNI